MPIVVLVDFVPDEVGLNVYVNAQLAPGAIVAPTQFCAALKFVTSDGAPPEKLGVCGVAEMLVIVTGSDTDAPTRTVPNDKLIGATVNAPPVPDSVIGKVSLLTPIVVLVDLAPSVVGLNVYVNVQLPLGASVVPAQFCDPPKFVGSNGAPPEKLGVCGTPEVLVIVTGSDAVAPTGTVPNARAVGLTLNAEMPVPESVIGKVSLFTPIVVLVDLAPRVVGLNVYVNVQLPLGASVVPAQFCDPPKFVGSSGAPPEKLGVCGTPEVLVIVTGSDAVAPTGTVPNASAVGLTLNAETPVPDSVIGKVSLSTPIVVLVDLAPSVVGLNVYVNVQLPLGGSVVPAQFCDPPKFVGSNGAPPEKLGVCGTAEMLVIVTGNDAEAPAGTLPKLRFEGVAVKFCPTAAPDDNASRRTSVSPARATQMRGAERAPQSFAVECCKVAPSLAASGHRTVESLARNRAASYDATIVRQYSATHRGNYATHTRAHAPDRMCRRVRLTVRPSGRITLDLARRYNTHHGCGPS